MSFSTVLQTCCRAYAEFSYGGSPLQLPYRLGITANWSPAANTTKYTALMRVVGANQAVYNNMNLYTTYCNSSTFVTLLSNRIS